MRKNRLALALTLAHPFAFSIPLTVAAQSPSATPVSADAPVKSLGVVTINSGAPTSLPTQIPITIEGITREQIEQSINATDSEDALKYFPSLLVRKRYIGDYNHAILSSRASGTGNSARSAVYADGILLSNYLGNGVGGLSFPPRWGLVTPEEIERVDLSGSVTYADSVIKENAGFVVVAGDTLDKQQPNIPQWRATALASYRFDEHWSASLGARYSGPQFRTLNNADVNGPTYQGVSEYFTTDVRVRYVVGKQWTAALGIDNLNNDEYWNFHPYPQRSYVAELKFDL